MGRRVPPITLAVKCPASWNAGVGVRCSQGPKEEGWAGRGCAGGGAVRARVGTHWCWPGYKDAEHRYQQV